MMNTLEPIPSLPPILPTALVTTFIREEAERDLQGHISTLLDGVRKEIYDQGIEGFRYTKPQMSVHDLDPTLYNHREEGASLGEMLAALGYSLFGALQDTHGDVAMSDFRRHLSDAGNENPTTN